MSAILKSDFGPIIIQQGVTADSVLFFCPAVGGLAFESFDDLDATLYDANGASLGAVDGVDEVADDDGAAVVQVTHDFHALALGENYRLDIAVTGTLIGDLDEVVAATESHYFDVVRCPLVASISVRDITALYPAWAYDQRMADEAETGAVVRSTHAELYALLKNSGFTPSTLVDREQFRLALIHRVVMSVFADDLPDYRRAEKAFGAHWALLTRKLRTAEDGSPESINTTISQGFLRRI